MKTCRTCGKRDSCVRTCPLIEGMLPKDDKGRDSHREVSMDPEYIEDALERYSFSEWHHYEFTSRYPKLDLSILSYKERRAVTLVASGLSQGEAAARLKITKGALQTYMKRARKKLCVLRSAHLIEEENSPGRVSGKGGGR